MLKNLLGIIYLPKHQCIIFFFFRNSEVHIYLKVCESLRHFVIIKHIAFQFLSGTYHVYISNKFDDFDLLKHTYIHRSEKIKNSLNSYMQGSMYRTGNSNLVIS